MKSRSICVPHLTLALLGLSARSAHTSAKSTGCSQWERVPTGRREDGIWKLVQLFLLAFGLLVFQLRATAAFGSGLDYDVTVNAKMLITSPPDASQGFRGVVAWLVPVDALHVKSLNREVTHLCIVQQNKEFLPHLVVLQVGSSVQFCNHDPWEHKPVAFSNGLQLHFIPRQSDRRRVLKFNYPGATYLFCEIHPQMNAMVLAVESPFFGVSDKWGRIFIRNVPEGTYSLHVWYKFTGIRVLPRLVVLPEPNCRRPTLSIALAKHTKAANETDFQQPHTGGTP